MTASLRDYLQGERTFAPMWSRPFDTITTGQNVPVSENPFFPSDYGGQVSWQSDNTLTLIDSDVWGGPDSGFIYLVVQPTFRVKIKIDSDNFLAFSEIPNSFMERFNIVRSMSGEVITFWMQKGDALWLSVDGEQNSPSVIDGLAGGNTDHTMLVLHDYDEVVSAFSVSLTDQDDDVSITLLEVEHVAEESNLSFDPADIPNPTGDYEKDGVVYVPESFTIFSQDNWKIVIHHRGPEDPWLLYLNGTEKEQYPTKDAAMNAALDLKGQAPEPDPDYVPPSDPDKETGIPFVIVALVGVLLVVGIVWTFSRKGGN